MALFLKTEKKNKKNSRECFFLNNKKKIINEFIPYDIHIYSKVKLYMYKLDIVSKKL